MFRNLFERLVAGGQSKNRKKKARKQRRGPSQIRIMDDLGFETLEDRVTPTTYAVPLDYATIQAAIDVLATDGAGPHTINVSAGTYTEDLVIADDADLDGLTIAGAGAGSSIIEGVDNVAAVSFPLADPNIDILADGVTITGFTIQGPAPAAGFYASGIAIGGSNIQIDSNEILVPNASSTDDVSQGIQTYRDAANPTGGDVSGLTIWNNTFSSLGAGTVGYEAIFINHTLNDPAGVGAVNIDGNTITGDLLRGISTERSNVIISDNVIETTLPRSGDASWVPGEALQAINVVDYSTRAQQDVVISGNTIQGTSGGGFTQGIRFGDGAGAQALTNVAVSNNFVNDSDQGILVRASAGAVTVTDNDVSGNTTAVVNTDVAALDASGNWWGSNVEADVVSQAGVLIDFSPYLDVGTDTDGGTAGFQGDFSTLHVTDAGDQVAGLVQEGIDLVTTSTVIVEAGLYIESAIDANHNGLLLQGATGIAADVIIDAGAAARVMSVPTATTVELRGLTLTGGLAATDSGGGVFNEGNLTLTNVAISANSADSGGGGLWNEGGTVTAVGSTFSGNDAVDAGGVGSNGGTVTLTNSTLSGNFADAVTGVGGGLLVFTSGTVNLNNVTITSNDAEIGGGVYVSASTLNINNSIVADNTATTFAPDVAGTVVSGDYNLVGDLTGSTGFTGVNDITGAPLLGPLQDNGGPTLTHALLESSPALEAGSTALSVDQRGFVRPVGTLDDIGAYEAGTVVHNTSDPDIEIRVVGGTVEILEGGIVVSQQAFVPTGSITINGTDAGDDTLTINLDGDWIPMGGLTFNGGTGGNDALVITGGGTTTIATYNYTNANDGSINLDGSVINYTGLEPIANAGDATNMIFNFPAGFADNATLVDAGAGQFTLNAPTFESTTANYPLAGGSLTINMNDGNDTLTITSLALNANTDLIIDGQAGNDTVSMNVAGTLNVTDALSVTAETINQTGPVNVSGTTLFNPGAANNLTLNNAGNDFVGAITVTAANNVTLVDNNGLAVALINASAAVNVTVTNGSLTSEGSDPGVADLVGTTATLAVTGAGSDIGTSAANPLEIDVTTLNAATAGAAAGDDIFVDDTAGGLAAGLINAGLGNVDIDVIGGSLTSAVVDGTPDIVGVTVTLDVATTGNTMGTSALAPLEIDATTLNAATAGAAVGDDIFIDDTAGGLAAGLITAGAGNVDIDVIGGSLTSAVVDGTPDIVGVTVTLDVATTGNTMGTSALAPLEIDATTLNAATAGAAIGDDIFIDDTAGGLAAGLVTAGAGNVDIDVIGGSLTSAVVDGTPDIVGVTVTLDVATTGNTMGTSAVAPLEIDATTLNAATAGAAIGDDIFIDDTAGGLAAGLVTAGAGNVDIDVIGGSLTSAVVDGTADIVGVTVTLDVATTGNTMGTSAVAPLEIDATTLNAATAGAAVGDDIFIDDTAGGLAAGLVTAGAGNVDIDVIGGSLTSAVVDGTPDIVGVTVTLDVATTGNTMGTSAVAPLEIDATTLNAATAGAAVGDDIFIDDTAGGLAAGLVTAGAGNVDIDVIGGSLTSAVVDGTPDIVGVTVTLDVATTGNTMGVSAVAPLEIDATTLNAATAGAAVGDDIFIDDTAGGLAAGLVTAGLGNVDIDVIGGSLTSTVVDGTPDIVGVTVTLDVATTGNTMGTSAVAPLEIDATTLNAATAGAAIGDDIFIDDTAGGLAAGLITAGAGNVDIDVIGGSLTSAVVDGTPDIVGVTVTLDVATTGNTMGTSAVAPLEIDATTLNAATAGAAIGDDIFIDDTAGGLAAGLITAGAGNVDIDVIGGSLTSAVVDGTADIVGVAVTLDVATTGNTMGVSAAAPLEVNANSLTATTAGIAGDDMFLSEVDGLTALALNAGAANVHLTVAGAIADADGADDITAADATVFADGGIGTGANPINSNVTQLDITNTTGGGIFVTDSAGGLTLIDLDASTRGVDGVGGGGAIVANSPLTISSDAITSGGMTYTATDSAAAGDDLTVDSGATVQDTSSTLTLNAGDDVDIQPGTSIQAASTLTINGDTGGAIDAAGSVIDLGGNLAGAGATPIIVNGNVEADSITIDSTGAGGTVNNILSNITINGAGGNDTLTLEDFSDATGDTVGISNDGAGAGTVTGLVDGGFAIAFTTLEQVDLDLGDTQADTLTVTPNANVLYDVDGNNPTTVPGDVLIYDATGNKDIDGVNSGTIWGAGVQDVDFTSFEEIRATGGNLLTDTIDLTDPGLVALGSQDGLPNEIIVRVDATGTLLEILFDGDTTGGGAAAVISTQLMSSVASLEISGSSDDDSLRIEETAGGLPIFSGQASSAHTNGAFNTSALTPASGNIGIHFDGAGGTTNSITALFTTARDVAYFSDAVGTANSGVINVSGVYTMSFENLTPITIIGAGGSLTVDATSTPATTTLTLDDDAGDTAGVGGNVITGDGGFETTYFTGFPTLTVRGGDGSETLTLVNADTAGAFPLTAITLDGDNTGGTDNFADILQVQNLPASINATLLGGAGNDTFSLFDGANSLDGILGAVTVSGEAGSDELTVTDTGTASGAAEAVAITGTTIAGITGPGGTGAAITYGTLDNGVVDTGRLVINGSNNGNTYNVQSTAANLLETELNTGNGDETVNINDGANTADGVISPIDLNMAVGTADTLNIVDTADASADVFHMNATDIGGGAFGAAVSRGGIFGANGILYYDGNLEVLSVDGPDGAGVNNTFNIDATGVSGAASSVTIDDGQGDATFAIQADAIAAGAAHFFNGNAGNDAFTLYFADGASVPAAAGTSLEINGDDPAADPANRDTVTIDTSADTGTSRIVGLTWDSNTSGDVDVTGLGTPTYIDLDTVETVTYVGDATNNDDDITVTAPTTADTVTVDPTGANSADLFLNGTPPASPGVAGLSTGPDISLGGIDSLLVDGEAPAAPLPADTLWTDLTGIVGASLEIIPSLQGVVGTWNFGAGLLPYTFFNFETFDASGGTYDLVVRGDQSDDANLVPPLGAGNGFIDGTADTIDVSINASSLLAIEVNGTHQFQGDPADITSLEIIGSTDDDALVITETANGLPSFTGNFGAGGVGVGAGVSGTGHVNQSMVDSTLAPTNIGLHFDGGAGLDVNSLNIALLTDQNVSYFSDGDFAVNSGNINVQGQFSLSFANLAPIDVLGAGPGSMLLVDATSTPATSTLTIDDDASVVGPFGALFGPAVAGDDVTAIVGNGGFETTRFAGFGTVLVRGGTGSETITLQNIDVGGGGNPLTSIILDGDNTTQTDASVDVLNARNLPAGISALLFGGAGADTFNLFDGATAGLATNTVDTLAGDVFVATTPPVLPVPFGFVEEAAVGDVLNLEDTGDAGGDNVIVTLDTITGITGFAGDPDVTYGTGGDQVEIINISTADDAATGEEVDVLTTLSGSVYTINTQGGADTVNVFSDADTQAAPGVTAVLDGIDGQLNLNTGAEVDTLNVSDFGDADADTYIFSYAGTATQIAFTDGDATQDILFDVSAADQLENFNIWGGTGNDTFTNDDAVGGTQLLASMFATASNTFYGNDGDDTFTFEWSAGFNLAAGTDFVINGNGQGAAVTNRDWVNLRTDAAGDGARTIGMTYPNAASGDLDVTGLRDGGGIVEINTSEQVVYQGDAVGDTVVATGTAADDLLSVTPLTSTSANVFIGGTPFLSVNDAAPYNSPATNNPGIAGNAAVPGSSFGPDININGMVAGQSTGLTVNGGAGEDRLIVNAPTEAVAGAAGSAAWDAGPHGGVGSVVLPAAGDGYDTITINYLGNNRIDINNGVIGGGGYLVSVNIGTGFAGAASQDVVVNTGEEADPTPALVADEIAATFSTTLGFQINGGEPPLPAAPPLRGDRLTLAALPNGNINIYADAAPDNDTQVGINDPNVSITSVAGGLSSQPVTYNNIELLTLRPDDATREVNIIGDNNGANPGQQDEIIVIGADIDSTLGDPVSDADGAGEFWVLINGSAPIGVFNTAFLNITGAAGDDDITLDPYADDITGGWEIDVKVDGGTGDDDIFYGNVERFASNNAGDPQPQPGIIFIDDSPDGSRAGVSEAVILAPQTTTGAGQIRSSNATDGTNILTVDFTTVEDVSFFFNDGTAGDTDSLTIQGTAAADTVTADLSAAGTDAAPLVDIDLTGGPTQLVQVENIAQATAVAASAPTLGAVAVVQFELLDGDDAITVTGRADGATTVNVDAGNPLGSDTISLLGTLDAADSYTVTPGASSDSGVIAVQLSGAAAVTTINFTNTEAININGGGGTGADTVALTGTNGNDAIAISPVLGSTAAAVSVNAQPLVTASNVGASSALNITAGEGDDVISVGALNGSNFTIDVDAGGPAGSDTVVFEGTTGDDTITYTPDAAIAADGQVVVNGITTSFHDAEAVTINALGQAGADSLAINGLAGTGDAVVLTPAGNGAGTVAVNGSSPVAFAGFETTTINTDTGTDTLTVNATDNADVVAITGTSVTVNGQVFTLTGQESVLVNLGAGNDVVSVTPSAVAVTVNGGGGTDALSFVGQGAAIAVDLAAQTITEAALAAATVNGVEDVTVLGSDGTADVFTVTSLGTANGLVSLALNGGDTNNDDGDTIDVAVAAGPNTVQFTPQSASSAVLSHAQTGPIVTVTGFNNAAGGLSITGGASVDTLEVLASDTNDAITATQSGIGTSVTVAPGGTAWVPIDMTAVEALNVVGGDGDDTLTVDNSAGLVLPDVSGIDFAGGAGSDTLVLTGTTAIDTSTYSVGPAVDAGTIVHGSLLQAAQTVTFTGLEPVVDLVAAANLVVNATNADNAIDYVQGSVATQGLIAIDGFETIEFANKTSLQINAAGGDDVIEINNPTTPTGLTAIVVNAGNPTASDELIVNAVSGSFDLMVVLPSGQGAGTVDRSSFGASIDVAYTGVEDLTLIGQLADGDAFGVDGTTEDDVFQYFGGATADTGLVLGTMGAGTITEFTLPSIQFSGMSQASGIIFNVFGNQGGSDTFVFTGTGQDDQLLFGAGYLIHMVDGALVAAIDTGTPSSLGTTNTVLLATGDGDDGISVTAEEDVTVIVNGGNPDSGSDTLEFISQGSTTVDLGASTIDDDVTASSPDVIYSGIETVDVTSGGQDLTVAATAGNDVINVTPLTGTSGTLQVTGLSPMVTFSATGTFTADGAGGSDTLVVNGDNGGNAIAVSAAAVTVDALLTVNGTAVEALSVNGLAGDDTFTVTAGTLPIFVDGGDPIGVTGDVIALTATGPLTFYAGAENDEGSFVDGGNPPVSFDHIEGATIDLAGNTLTILGTNGDDDITIVGTAADAFDVTINDGLPISYVNVTGDVLVDAQNGDDDIDVELNGFTLAGTLTVNGNLPASGGGDTLTVAGAAGTWAPSGIDGGAFTVDTEVIAVQAIENVVFDGEGTGTLTVTGTAADNSIVHTPGSATDSGQVQVDNLLGITYSNVVSLDVDGAAGTDTLTYEGTAAGDFFTLQATTGAVDMRTTPIVGVGAHVTLQPAAVEYLVLDGQDGDDVFLVNAVQPYTNVFLQGGGPGGSDLAQIVGSAGIVDAFEVIPGSVAGDGAVSGVGATVVYQGVESLNLFGDPGEADSLVVNDDLADNVWEVDAGTLLDGDRIQIDDREVIEYTGFATVELRETLINVSDVDSFLVHPTGLRGFGTSLTIVGDGPFDRLELIGTVGADTVTSTAATILMNGVPVSFTSGTFGQIGISTAEGNDSIVLTDIVDPKVIDAGAGDDTVDLSAAVDATIFGGIGDDVLIGSPAVDLIDGGSGDDYIDGGDGNDTILGGDDNDYIIAGLGDDWLYGGSGSDWFVWNVGDGSDVIEGGEGNDVLFANGDASDDIFLLSANGTLLQIDHDPGGDVFDVRGIEEVNILGEGGADEVTVDDLTVTDTWEVNVDLGAGDQSADTVTVNARTVADDLMITNTDTEVNVAGLVYDVNVEQSTTDDLLVVNGSTGNDTIAAAAGVEAMIQVTLNGDAGNDWLSADGTLNGGAGNDTLIGGAGNNALDGGAGDDVFVGGGGTDAVVGDAGADTILVEGTAGADVISLELTGGGDLLVTVNGDTTTYTGAFADVERALVQGLAGDDTLTVDSTNGAIGFLEGIDYDGGTGTDVLILTGGTADSDTYAVGPVAGAGTSTIVIGGVTQTVQFENLEPVIDLVAGPLTVTATAADNAIAYTVGSLIDNGLVTIDGFESIEFSNKTTLQIDAGSGDDAISLDNPNTPIGLTGITVNGQGSALGDSVVVYGTTAQETIAVAPASADGATVQVGALPAITVTTAESLVVNGAGGNDTLNVATDGNNNSIQVAAGATADAGQVQVDSLLGLEFANLGAGGALTLTDAGGSDTLVIEGTSGRDVFTVPHATVAAPSIAFNGQIGIGTTDIETYQLRGEAGDDIFNLTAQDAVQLVIEADDPGASDVINFTATGATTLDLAAGTIEDDATAVTPDVVYSGVETIYVIGAATDLTVLGTANDDQLEVTPLGTDSGRLHLAAGGPQINFSGTATLLVDGSTGDDTLVVTGSSASNVINIDNSAPSVEVTGREVVNHTGFEAIEVNGLAGNDTFNVTPDAVNNLPITIDGGSPIGQIPSSTGDLVNLITGGAAFTFDPGPEADSGFFVVTGTEPVSFDQIEQLQVDGVAYLLPDAFEPNDSIAAATTLGSVSQITMRDLTIHEDALGTTDEDYYRITAPYTGKLIVNAFFTYDEVGGDRDQGDIDIELLDSAGNWIAGSYSVTDNERIVIPVVSQETYYLHVYSADGDPNSYDLEIEHFEAPVPSVVELDPNDDTGISNLDAVTFTETPRVLIQAPLATFAGTDLTVLRRRGRGCKHARCGG